MINQKILSFRLRESNEPWLGSTLVGLVLTTWSSHGEEQGKPVLRGKIPTRFSSHSSLNW